MNETEKETLRLLIQTIRALEDKSVTPDEAAVLCKLAGDLLERIAPLVHEHRLSWLIRASIYGAKSALMEASHYFEGLQDGDD